MDKIVINGEIIPPGKHQTIQLPLPKLYDWTPMSMPVHVIRGKTSGPILCITAALHGDEVNGVEIIRRLIKRSFLKKIKGTLIAIPIVNVFGFLHQTRYLMDRRDLNRSFPGSDKGSIAARICHLISKEILTNATHIIDLHTGSLHRSNLPQIRSSFKDGKNLEIAKAFHAPVIVETDEILGSFRREAQRLHIPFIVYEAGEALRFDEVCIRTGIHGIMGVMHHLGMIDKYKPTKKHIESAVAHSSFWVRAPTSGILRTYKSLGKRVKKGELLAVISNPSSNEEHKLYSPLSGIIITNNNLPLVHEGGALFHIACFDEVSDLEIEENIHSLKIAYSNDADLL